MVRARPPKHACLLRRHRGLNRPARARARCRRRHRPLLNELRRTFGGAIDDVNAEAIALAAAELYDEDVDPMRWQQAAAAEILDSLGVPRAGTFIRYSLTDRLCVLRQSADPSRTQRAHALLTELGAPEYDSTGSPAALRYRLDRVMEGTAPLARASRPTRRHAEPRNGPDDPVGAIAGGDESGGQPSVPSLELPVADLVGLGALVAGIQQEVVDLRQEIATVKGRLDEVLALLSAGPVVTADTDPPTAPDRGEALPAPVDEALPESAEPVAAGDPDDPDDTAEALATDTAVVELEELATVASPDEVTEVVILGGPTEPPPAHVRWRRRLGVPLLIIIAMVVGVIIAGTAIAVSVFGWNEIRQNYDIGAINVYDVSARDLAEQVLDALDRPPTG